MYRYGLLQRVQQARVCVNKTVFREIMVESNKRRAGKLLASIFHFAKTRPGHDIQIDQLELAPHRNCCDATIVAEVVMLSLRPFSTFASEQSIARHDIWIPFHLDSFP